ncbi:MAG TPA: hypothetical protein VII45_12035 [Solirubrobacterales bacterium]
MESYQAEVQYKQELEAFKAENPGVKVEDESPWASDKPAEAKPAEAEAKPAEEPPAAEAAPADADAKPADADAEQFSLADDAPITPQMVNDLLKGDEALKAAIEANPAAKGAIMKLARENAELVQFKGIFPSAASATFAREKANRFVTLTAQVQAGAESPEKMATAFQSFAQEFAVMGADGKQVMDAQGNPEYADDFYAFNEHVVDRYINGTLPDVEARLTANKYADDAERERDQDLKLALDIIKGDLHPQTGPKADPDLSHLDEKTRGEVQSRLDEAKRIEAANLEKEKGAGKRTREQVRQEGTTKFFADAGKRTFDQVAQIVDKLRAAGAVIPQWQLDAKVPGKDYSAFNNEVGNAIEQHIKADPYLANQQLELELQYLANPSVENHQERIKAFDGILQAKDHTGKSLLNRIVTKLVRQYGSQVQAGAAAATTPEAPNASREPVQGGPVRPKQMTSDDAYKAAEIQLAKEVQGWQNMDQAERMTLTLGRQRQLMAAKG